MVKEDHTSQDELGLSLSRGDVVEILDNSINGKWFVRAQTGEGGGVSHGWFPSELLERVQKEGEEEVDVGKKAWIQLTAGKCVRTYVTTQTAGRSALNRARYKV